MTFTKLFAIAALATTAPVPLAIFPETAVAQPARQQADFKTAADAVLADAYPADGPGAAVIVTRGGAVVYSGGRGLADVEAGEAITADNVFRLGSIAKQFTAAVVLQLVEEGKLSLDDPVSRFFPDYPQPGAHATVRQLLNHTSGIQDLSKIPGWIPANYQKPHTTAELLAVFRDLPAKFEPGTDWEYNNGGYILLGAIVEEVTGNPWHEEVADRITGPLGLETIVHNVSGKQVPAAARGYTEADGRQQVAPLTHLSVPHAAGGLIGSPADLAEWSRALHRGRVVGPELYREMISAARLADGSTEPYGFGLRLEKLRGHKAIVHGGAIRGFSTDSVYISSEDVFVGVFANSDDPAVDPTVVMVRLAAMAIGEPFPAFEKVALGETEVDPLLGLYSYDGGERRFFRKDRRLFTRLNTNQDIEVSRQATTAFSTGRRRSAGSRSSGTPTAGM